MKRLISLLALVLTLPAAGALGAENPYKRHSDEELTALAADWDALDRHQRRALLTEMKLRMAKKGKRDEVIHIRTERRYGRLIRQPDGRVIRIETQVVHVRPVKPEDLKARHGYGVGFEHRVARREERLAVQHDGKTSSEEQAGAAQTTEAAVTEEKVTLESVLESLTPTTQAPKANRLPIHQASEHKP